MGSFSGQGQLAQMILSAVHICPYRARVIWRVFARHAEESEMEINIDTIHCRPRRGPDHFQAPSKGATRSVAERRSRILGGSGFASNDEGVKRVLDDFDLMRDRSKDSVLITSDVSGMDFSLGGLALLAGYHADQEQAI